MTESQAVFALFFFEAVQNEYPPLRTTYKGQILIFVLALPKVSACHCMESVVISTQHPSAFSCVTPERFCVRVTPICPKWSPEASSFPFWNHSCQWRISFFFYELYLKNK